MRWLGLVVLAAGCFYEPKRPLDPDALDPDAIDAPPDADTRPNIVFVTSQTYMPGMLGGLAGADLACQTAATMRNLPGTYRAWLSTSTTDAISRLAGARGWVRPDGKPVADLPGDLVNHILYPPRIDERKNPLPEGEIVITGSDSQGMRNTGLECVDWSLNAGMYVHGYPDAGSSLWTNGGQTGCQIPGHLYCFGIDRSNPPPPLQPQHPFGFLTSGPHQLGVGTPDQICMNTSTGNPILAGGPYKALLAYAGSTAKSRFTRTGPWYRLDGVPFTTDLTGFDAPLTVTQNGNEVPGDVFFGATDPTSMAQNNCVDWSPSGGTTSTGNSGRSTGVAFAGSTPAFSCMTFAFYYCLED